MTNRNRLYAPDLELRLDNVTRAVGLIRNADTANELRQAWRNFLYSFAESIGWMISAAGKSSEAKVWGHKLKNASQKDDEGLVFLRIARNHVSHGLTDFADFCDRSAQYDRFISMAGNQNISFHNNVVVDVNGNTRALDNFDLKLRDGKIVWFNGTGRDNFFEHRASIKLREIYSEQEKMTACVPETIDGKVISKNDPLDMAYKAENFVRSKSAELYQIWEGEVLN